MNAIRKFLPFLFAFALVTWLALRSGISVDEIVASFAQIDLLALVGILFSTGVFLALSTLKWQKVMGHLAPHDQHHHGWSYGFYHTALGAVLSLVLLPHAATVLARGYGDKFKLGKSPAVTAAATLYEQLFDLIPILVFASTALLAQVLGWSAGTWIVATAAAATLAGFAIALVLRTRFWLLVQYAPGPIRNKLEPRLEWFARPSAQTLLEPRFILEIYAISVVRYFVLFVRSYLIFVPMHLSLSDFGFVKAYSIVCVSRLLFITPGGLGIAEWSWTGILAWLGMPLQESVGFILANRVLNWVSILLIFLVAWLAFAFKGGAVRLGKVERTPEC